jgi:cytoskeletal protein RodZ
MALLLLEALLALLILIGIVWWTMFSGRTKGEIRSEEPSDQNTNIESK